MRWVANSISFGRAAILRAASDALVTPAGLLDVRAIYVKWVSTRGWVQATSLIRACRDTSPTLMSSPETQAKPPQRLPDILPDHALVPGDEDLFNHEDFVERLLAVVKTASVEHTSANVALYGSWGSGKSGTANLLMKRLKGAEDLHSASFNAFAYAKKPLLRQFIVHLAGELLGEKKREAYEEKIYEQTARTRFDFRGLDRKRLKKPAMYALGGILLVAVVVAILLGVAEGNERQAIKDTLFGVFPSLAPTAVLVALLVWGLRFLTVAPIRAVPDSEEQFEQLFKKLLSKDLDVSAKGPKKLVVFIDELDRCSPTEVVATLETLRTFLGVPGCVFIVAADQQALEHALTQRVRQATPVDPANPYYSAGNAYLDKIFQYQLAFPPLRPRRLTHYALRLVDGRGGVWQDIDVEHAISVLLPIHIHSPRRVKVLLNSFALAYATAKSRADRGELDLDLSSRASELAKLVCIRTEFPLFARELEFSDQLPAAVLRAHKLLQDDEENPEEDDELQAYPPGVAERALLYAQGKLPVAELLGEREQAPPAAADQPQPQASEPDPEPRAPIGPASAATVQRAYALQLVSYLEKTVDIPGPRDDLIHLESAGAVWGLDPQFAQRLQREALGNRLDQVIEEIDQLGEEDQANALRLLGALTRESVGNDADNSARALLAATAAVQIPLGGVAPSLTADVDNYRRRRGLRSEDLPGALSLALAGESPALLAHLLEREEALTDQNFRLSLLAQAEHLWPDHSERLASVCAAEMTHDSVAASGALVDLPETLAADLIREAHDEIKRTTRGLLKRAQDPETEADDRERLERSADRGLEELAGVIRGLAEKDRTVLAELALLPLVSLGRAADLERTMLAELAPLETPEASLAVLQDLENWPKSPEVLVELLQALNPKLVKQIPEADAAMSVFGDQLWSKAQEAGPVPDSLWSQLKRFSESDAIGESATMAESIETTLKARVDSAAAAAELETKIDLARRLSEVGFFAESVLADAVLEAIAASVAAPALGTDSDEVLRHVRSWLELFAETGGQASLDETRAALRDPDCWVASPQRETMLVELDAALVRFTEVDSFSATEVATLGRDHGEAFAPGAAAWVRALAPSPAEAFTALQPFLAQRLPSQLRAAVSSYADQLSPKDRAQLSLPAIARAFELAPRRDFFHAAQLNGADEELIAAALVDLYADADNKGKRELVLEIWERLEPRSPDARRTLIRQVFLPLAEGGKQAFDLARRRLKLCADPPHGTKQELVDRLPAAAPDKERAEKMVKGMTEVGLIEKKQQKGRLRRALGL